MPCKADTPSFSTEVLAFEDNFIYTEPKSGSLLYRIEGTGKVTRTAKQDGGSLHIELGPISYIHPAQYDRPALKLRLLIESGEPGIAICHNGMKDNSGGQNPNPGLELVLRVKDTALRDLKTGQIIAVIPEVFPRGTESTLCIAWDFDDRKLRVDLPKRSYELHIPDTVSNKGGFALRAPKHPATSYKVKRIQVLWQDNRQLVLYDGYETVYDLHGKLLGKIPPAKLPSGLTGYITTAVDLRRERALLILGNALSTDPKTFQGWGVRDLRTGKVQVISRESTINGCIPFQGGGGMDGYWLMQSWNPPASTCWLDWNAYDKGDIAGFVKSHRQGVKGENGTFTGFHDPSSALDGSLARYLRITENWRGANHLTVHPNLLPYAPFADITMAYPTHPDVSHTGPAGMPTQLVVRDRDRAWYEQWAYRANHLHNQNRGYNLFSREDDWGGPFYATKDDADPYNDYANQAPSLTEPGKLLAQPINWHPREKEEAQRIRIQGLAWLRWDGKQYVEEEKLPFSPWPTPYQMLMDPQKLVLP